MTNKLSVYADCLHSALVNVDQYTVDQVINILTISMDCGHTIYSCGNGGSAAISNHLVCDCVKGVACDTNFYPKIQSLNCNDSIVTAIANDIGYEHIFSKQLEWSAAPGDILVVISSSGNSPNIVNAIIEAKKLNIKTIAIVGFDGGKCKELADICVHIPYTNYGIIEDASQAIMHYIAQSIRIQHTYKKDKDLVL